MTAADWVACYVALTAPIVLGWLLLQYVAYAMCEGLM